MRQLVVQGLNHLVRSESWAQERLRQRAGEKLLVEAGWFTLRLTINEQGCFCVSDASAIPDVTLTLPVDAAVSALFDRERLFASVRLDGSAEVVESLAFVFRNLKWDAEADLAAVVGDIPARRLALAGRTLAAGIQESLGKAGTNIAEYAVSDSGLLASEADLQAFGDEVNSLRDNMARLEMRISRL